MTFEKYLLIIPNGHLVMLTLNSHALLNDFDGSITSTKSAKDQLNSKKKKKNLMRSEEHKFVKFCLSELKQIL